MTSNFFTIVSSYFHCCCCKNNNINNNNNNKNDEKKNDDYQVNSGENSPFTFEDLSAITDSGTSSEWSSSSTLDGYDNNPALFVKDSFLQRNKKYQRKLFFLYKEDCENHDHDEPSP